MTLEKMDSVTTGNVYFKDSTYQHFELCHDEQPPFSM